MQTFFKKSPNSDVLLESCKKKNPDTLVDLEVQSKKAKFNILTNTWGFSKCLFSQCQYCSIFYKNKLKKISQ